MDFIYKTFDFKYSIELSTKPEKAMGSKETWDKAESALKEALEERKIEFKINEGDGAFYGPKIDFHLRDTIGRTWQCGTIQLDFSMPEKFDLEYIGEDGKKHRPIMLHRAIYGSIERFLGILIEHYVGAFPLWLSPIQIMIIPISEKFITYSNEVMGILKKENIRVRMDASNESLGKRIRNAEKEKIPYILVIGEKEQNDQMVAVRKRSDGDQGPKKLDNFISEIKEKIKEKK